MPIPQMSCGGGVDAEEQPERDDHEGERLLVRIDRRAGSAPARRPCRAANRQRQPPSIARHERDAGVVHRPDDERGEHRHLALREVDQPGGPVDQDQPEREHRVDRAVAEADRSGTGGSPPRPPTAEVARRTESSAWSSPRAGHARSGRPPARRRGSANSRARVAFCSTSSIGDPARTGSVERARTPPGPRAAPARATARRAAAAPAGTAAPWRPRASAARRRTGCPAELVPPVGQPREDLEPAVDVGRAPPGRAGRTRRAGGSPHGQAAERAAALRARARCPSRDSCSVAIPDRPAAEGDLDRCVGPSRRSPAASSSCRHRSAPSSATDLALADGEVDARAARRSARSAAVRSLTSSRAVTPASPGRRPDTAGPRAPAPAALGDLAGRSPARRPSSDTASPCAMWCSTSSTVSVMSSRRSTISPPSSSTSAWVSPLAGSSSMSSSGSAAQRPGHLDPLQRPVGQPAARSRGEAARASRVERHRRRPAAAARCAPGSRGSPPEAAGRRRCAPSITFSRTDSEGTRPRCWKVRATPLPATRCAGTPSRSSPANRTADRGRVVEAGAPVEERRLAGTVRADQRTDLAALDGEGQVVERDRRPPKRTRTPLDVQQGTTLRHPTPLSRNAG